MLTLLLALGQSSARADVSAVTGSAFGYQCIVNVFTFTCSPPGPAPSVTLPSNGAPQSASLGQGSAVAGPATIFSWGQIQVSSSGSLGSTGGVTSSSTVTNVNASGQENFTASSLLSSCTANEASGASGSTTINGGTLVVDNGDSDPTNAIPDHAPVQVTLDTTPAAGTTIPGHVHIGPTTDEFTWTFNEQSTTNGVLTVTAAHQDLIGPTAVGDLWVGRVVCGVTVMAPPPPPASADLSVAIADSPDPVASGGTVTYTVTVANAGPDPAAAVFASFKVNQGRIASASGATCVSARGGLSCDLGTIAAGGTKEFTVTVTARRRALTATSTVTSSTSDPSTANNSDTETTAIA